MRVFLISCLSAIVIAVVAVVVLSAVQKPAGAAYVGDGARVSPRWSFREVISKAKTAPQNVSMVVPDSTNALNEDCDVTSAWAWIMADFRPSPTGDSACDH
jgi:hypothetical protein